MRLCLFLVLFLSGCGYTLVNPSAPKTSIYVPFIDGDMGGELTRALIRELSESEHFRFSPSGRLLLEVVITDFKDEHVGFRYDQNSEGDLISTIIPSETRSSILVEITLIDSFEDCILFGPARISASQTFDHDWYTSHGAVNVFSLGQVTDFFDAKDGIYPPLAKKLSQKIADLLDQVSL